MKQIFDRRAVLVLIAAVAGARIGVPIEPYGTVCRDWPPYCFESGSTGSILGSAFVFGACGAVGIAYLLYRNG